MRLLTKHQTNAAKDLHVSVLDEIGHGGACHSYLIQDINNSHTMKPVHLEFQNGPINEDGNGVNGLTHEALLAVIIDRLEGFQSGPYACYENDMAVISAKSALEWLKKRTLKRVDRGVEGTNTV